MLSNCWRILSEGSRASQYLNMLVVGVGQPIPLPGAGLAEGAGLTPGSELGAGLTVTGRVAAGVVAVGLPSRPGMPGPELVAGRGAEPQAAARRATAIRATTARREVNISYGLGTRLSTSIPGAIPIF